MQRSLMSYVMQHGTEGKFDSKNETNPTSKKFDVIQHYGYRRKN